MFHSRAPRAVAAALTAVVLIVGLMASATSAAPPPGKGKPTPSPTPTPLPTPTPTPTPISDTRTVYFGDAPRSEEGEGKLIPSTVTAGNVFEFTMFVQNDGSQRLTHSGFGYGNMAVARTGSGPSLPAGASIISATLISGEGSCEWDDLGALCDLGQFDAGESATVQVIVNAPSEAVVATTYASFKVAENVPDQGANRNTFFADGTLDVGPTNSNSNATYKFEDEGALSLSTNGQTLVKKDSMTTTVSGPDGTGAISISEEDCDNSCVGQIATVHVRDGALQTPYLLWTLVIVGSIDGVITHTLDDGTDVPISASCTGETDVDCIVSNDRTGNVTTIIFRTATNGKVRAN